jgi:hypothetical protein
LQEIEEFGFRGKGVYFVLHFQNPLFQPGNA